MGQFSNFIQTSKSGPFMTIVPTIKYWKWEQARILATTPAGYWTVDSDDVDPNDKFNDDSSIQRSSDINNKNDIL